MDRGRKDAQFDPDILLALKSMQTGFRNVAAEFRDTHVAAQYIQWCRPMDHPTVTSGNAAPIPKIMIVDDSPYIRRLLVALLSRKYAIIEADSSVSALQLAKVEARRRGADSYFLKPFSPCAVAAWVESRLSSPAPLLQ